MNSRKNMLSPKYVVGIGASAGGLEAIQQFFDHVPASKELTFIIAQHLSPDFVSMVSSLLAHHTSMPIMTVKNKMALQPGVIYLIPPTYEVEIEHHRFKLNKLIRNALSLPINTLFESLAQGYKKWSIGIILSGTGADGSFGMAAIAKNKGLTVVQDPAEAKFTDMPNASIATGQVCAVLPVAEIADLLFEYMNHPAEFNKNVKQTRVISKSEYNELFHLLNIKHRINFNLYKLGTLSRRIQRRMQLLNIQKVHLYLDYLANNEEGLEALYHDLLISVTAFFRDPDAFSILEAQVIPALFTHFKKTNKDIRIWVSACATGEEAYSIAILFKHYADEHQLPYAIKVFASELCPSAIEKAKKGRYSYKSVENIPAHLLNTYFIKSAGFYEIIPEIRSKILFTSHNLLSDSPFTKIDLISCRNVLIYIKPKEQERITNVLRFSLTIGGFLFLGPSEGLSTLEPDLVVINHQWKIYEKTKPSTYPLIPKLPFIDPLIGEINPILHGELPLYAYNAIVHEVVTAGFIIDTAYVVLHSVGMARDMLLLPEGVPTLILTKIILDELKGALITALHQAKTSLMPVVYNHIMIHHRNGAEAAIKMAIHPIMDPNNKVSYFWIRLEPVNVVINKKTALVLSAHTKDTLHNERIKALEQELSEARLLLKSSIEIKEQINEELQSTIEELMASNEELQSSNEELQSVNEELFAVNMERLRQVEQIIQGKTDMDNLIRGAEICTLILNNKLEIYMFTPAIKTVFKLVDHDIGRPLEIFKHNLKFNNLINKIEEVLTTHKAYEQEVMSKQNYAYFLKIIPYYNNHTQVVSGVVITLTDINETKLLQQNKMELESDLKLALKTGLIGVWHSNLKTKDFSFDETLMTILGLKNHSSITKFKQFINLIHPNDKKLLEEAFATAVSKNESLEQSFRIYRPDGSIRHLSCSANVHNGLSASTNHLTGICWDMTERYWLEERIIDAEHLNIGLDSITDGWWDWDLVTDKAYLSPLLKKTIGYRDAELPNQRAVYEQLIVQRDRIDARKLLETYIASNNTQPVIKEIRMKHKTGHVIWILSRIKGIANKEGKLIRIISTITDISALKEKERALKKLAYHDPLTLVSNKPVYFEAVFRAIARAKRNHSLFAVMFVDVDDFKGVNDQWGHSVGDGLLCEVTNRLTNLSRSIDLLARIGGDEFAILLEEVSTIDEVRTIAARYIAGFSEPMILNDTSLVVTISIGVALFPVHGKTVSEVLSHADKNMYRAKKAGKNQFVLCD